MSVVLLKGMLYGVGREADCEVLAWQVVIGGTPIHLQIRVVSSPLDLPDGKYTLVLDELVYSTEKRQGWWQMTKIDGTIH